MWLSAISKKMTENGAPIFSNLAVSSWLGDANVVAEAGEVLGPACVRLAECADRELDLGGWAKFSGAAGAPRGDTLLQAAAPRRRDEKCGWVEWIR